MSRSESPDDAPREPPRSGRDPGLDELEAVPDADRISAVETVRDYPSDPAAPSPVPPPSRSEEAASTDTEAWKRLAAGVPPRSEGGPREGGPREGGPREGGPRESGPREGGPREGGPREGGPREGGPREGGPREGGPRPATAQVSTSVWQGNPLDLASENGGGRFDAPIEARYELLRRIASGGMAEIYKARHRNLGKEFALKVIHYDGPVEGARLRQLFYREAQLVSRMDHPNIVSVVDFGVDPAHGAYIVMEYLKGETLHQRLKRQHRLRLHTTLEIGLQVAEALHYMHGQGVIHCDVKAENVLLCRAAKDSRQRLVVKMIDFGLSRPRTAGVTLSPAEVGGTPQYMAPELIRGGAPQPSMDIYALGVLVYEMLTGAVPFPGATAADIVQAQLHEEPTAPSALMDEPLESRVEAVVLEALRKDPAKRQPSMGQVIFQLRTLMQMYDLRGARLRHPTPSEQAAVVPPQRASHQLVQGCPFPLFQLDPEGRIVFVNKAFCRFVRGTATELLGQRIGDTRLGVVYPSIQTEAESCGRRSDRIPTRRTFGFELEGGQRVSLMCWLRPETDDQDRVVRVNGYIHGFS